MDRITLTWCTKLEDDNPLNDFMWQKYHGRIKIEFPHVALMHLSPPLPLPFPADIKIVSENFPIS